MMPGRNYSLAPVYDLGSSLFSKRTDSVARERLSDETAIEQDAFGTNISCYRLQDETGSTHAIHPFDYMAASSNPDLEAAIVRFVDALNMDAIDALVDDIPTEAFGHILMSDAMRASHKRLLRERYEQGILPLLNR